MLRKVVHTPPPPDVTVQGPCWIWQGEKMPNGYGKHAVKGKRIRAVHRVMWEAYNGREVPEGLQLDHLCHTRSCCSPIHLEPVTPSVNTERQDHYNRGKTHCPHGHEYTEANTQVGKDGKRRCRTCKAERRAST